MIRTHTILLALVFAGIIATSCAFGGQKHWLGSSTGNWSGTNDWSPAGVPAVTDTVTIGSEGTGPCYVNGNDTCAAVTITAAFASFFEIGNSCSLTVNGNFLQLGSTVFFQGGNGGTLTIDGNLKRLGGTFNTALSTIQMVGTSVDTIQGIASLNNLTCILNAYYRVIGNTAVTGTLNISGVIQTGSDTLSVTSFGNIFGYIDGAMSHTFNSASTMKYSIGSVSGHTGSGPVTANVTAGTFPATLVIQTNSSNNPPVVDISKCVDRKWMFNTVNGAITSCNLTFDYSNTTIGGTEASYVLAKYNGTAYVVQSSNAPNTGAHTISINGVSSPSSTWTIGQAAALPIALTSLTASAADDRVVRIDWSTATETNSYGFFIQRKMEGTSAFADVSGFIAGAGSSLEEHNYSFTDHVPESGTFVYRIRQSDLDGGVSYSSEINIVVAAVLDVQNGNNEALQFRLLNNYPNPFNPSTQISYTLPEDGYVTVAIYNVLGQLVALPVSERQSRGLHSVRFDASQLSSGVYYYSVQAGAFSAIKKMVLAR